jgi:hypothetical protein
MSKPDRVRALTAVAAVLLVATSACGDNGVPRPSSTGTSPAPTDANASRENGDWLLRFTTAGGADGERERSVFVRYDPSTGAVSARTLPAVTASDASEDEQVLLVSADHRWAIPDTGVPRSQSRTGKLVLYSVTDDTTTTLDIRAATGERELDAVAWAFDPTDGNLLRVVDRAHDVWRVDLAAMSATKEGRLPKRAGWIYGNGFDKTTGEPYIESIDSDRTDPAGNGDSDVRPIERQGGTLLRDDGDSLDGLPKPPCGFAGAFRFDDGDAWLFCADTPSISAYRLGEGGAGWSSVGTPSAKIVPGVAVDMTFALPPLH